MLLLDVDWLRCDRRSCRLAGKRPAKACAARSDNQPLYAIATVTGTERDPQCRSQQIATLEDAGIAVVSSLPEATLLAAALIHPLSPAAQQHTPSLLENVAVINIGLRSFALELQSASKTGCALPMVASRRRQ